ncbi:putative protein binding protein [Cinnamomum micranthum f. kanehirae]|uniref:Phorbol-ester/DAG-type domain-containing protein n=1 Tax=Cinnamomum micranthum f. kanehirae TaxID=337451 RepID=A0A3S3NRG7_9MAGN|nr:putative protein binding protein [Cinnamomum micranthum f. kanehirae]
MGRVQEQERSLQHFSHAHPLQLCNLQPRDQTLCNGCKSPLTGSAYRCTPCNYYLHKTCTQIPNRIHHPSHPHPLALLPIPAYFTGSFFCDACGRQGTGFSFHCEACEFDLHAPCASFPRTISHRAHMHPLVITYTNPYNGLPYTCDICKGLGINQWVYRCAPCGFDAHLKCAFLSHSVDYQRTVARQSGGPPFGPHGPSNSWPNVLQSLGRMTLNNNSSFGDGSTAVQGGGLGQQVDVLNSGSSVNHGGFSLTDGLMDMLNGFDWSSLAN